ncbi:MAG: hypothetical protein JNJ54_22950 [Myxococcaceae bacterium]|nr:hypothetical protein [Myxococcaceae bacterium]
MLQVKGIWAKLDALAAPGIAEAVDEARRNIASVLAELAREWRSNSRGLLEDHIAGRARQARFETRLYDAAQALGLATSISKSAPRLRAKHPTLWALGRLTSAVTNKRAMLRLTEVATEGGAGPVAAAEEVIAEVLGRTRNGVVRHLRKHARSS